MKSSRLAMFALMIGIALPGACQDAVPAIRGPILGLVFDPAAQGLRPILGIAGASTLGDPLDIGTALASAVVSPQHDYALGQIQGEPGVILVELAGAAATVRPLPSLLPRAEQVALSPTGAAAALYSRSRIQRVTGLPASPSVRGEVDLGDLTPASIAISDDGAVMLVSAQDGSGVAVIGEDGTVLRTLGAASSLAFLYRSHDALLANPADHTVYLVRDVTDRAESVLLANERDGVSAPLAVAVSSDNSRAFIADNSGVVAAVDLAGGVPRFARCPCTPTGLYPLTGQAVFRLTQPSDAPLWVYQDGSPEARILFVPPSLRTQTSEGNQP